MFHIYKCSTLIRNYTHNRLLLLDDNGSCWNVCRRRSYRCCSLLSFFAYSLFFLRGTKCLSSVCELLLTAADDIFQHRAPSSGNLTVSRLSPTKLFKGIFSFFSPTLLAHRSKPASSCIVQGKKCRHKRNGAAC